MQGFSIGLFINDNFVDALCGGTRPFLETNQAPVTVPFKTYGYDER
jgi:hypothetical protein